LLFEKSGAKTLYFANAMISLFKE